LLKVLEGESGAAPAVQTTFIRERVLPDLARNIQCGNSLIGPDFYDQVQLGLFDDEERYRINVFDWQAAFPAIMRAGGFDAVIGNPPYGIVFDEEVKSYVEGHYRTFVRNNDNYIAFSQRAIELLRITGRFGLIIPNTFLTGPYFDALKSYILENACVLEIVDFGLNQVFPKPNVFTCLVFLQRKASSEECAAGSTQYAKVNDIQTFPQELTYQTLNKVALQTLYWMPADDLVARLLNAGTPLDAIAWVKDVGLNYWTQGRGKTRGGSIADRTMYEGNQQNPEDKPFLKGRDISRYSLTFGGHWLRHNYQEFLDPAVDTLRFSPDFLYQEKLVYRQTSDRIVATLDASKYLTDKTVHVIVLREAWKGKIDLRYLLSLLNSRLLSYVYQCLAQEEGRTFAQVKTFRMKQLPIRTINFSDPADKQRHDQMVALVERMLALHRQRAAARTPTEQTMLDRQIAATDAQIDRLVYALYGLTEAEIALVDGAR
jgi:hypothetical protein